MKNFSFSQLRHLFRFGFSRHRSFPAAILCLGFITLAPIAQAQVVHVLTITGEATVSDGMTVFGQELTQPFTLEMVYDPALNTNTNVFMEEEQLAGSDYAGNDFYGYSASGVVSLDLTFGDPASATEISLSGDDLNLNLRSPAAGISAHIWMNTDIMQSTPSLIDMRINLADPGENEGGVGIGSLDGNFDSSAGIWNVSILNEVGLEDELSGGEADGTWSNIEMTVIPEPATFGLLFSGLIALFVAMRRRRGT